MDKQPSFVRMFIAEVKDEMMAQKLSTPKLAQKIGVSRVTLSRFLNYHTMPPLRHLDLIATALDMQVVLCLMEKIDD